MAKIEAFCGVRFNLKKVGALAKVVCPPYDVINKQQRLKFMKNSKYNAVYLELPKGKNTSAAHKNAKKLLDSWIKQNILICDKKPCVYICLGKYKIANNTKIKLGFISLLEIEGDNKKILPHEKIFNKFKFERFNLMKTTQAHTSPIFCMFCDKTKRIEKALLSAIKNKKPIIDICAEGVNERVWKVDDDKFIDNLQRFMFGKKVFIADGHHRFQASLYLRDYLRKKERVANKKMPSRSIGAPKNFSGENLHSGYDYAMVYFLSMQDKGLTILPTHRTVKYLPDNFSEDFMLKKLSNHFQTEIVKSKNELVEKLQKAAQQKRHAFGFFFNNTYLFSVLKDEKAVNNIGSKDNCPAWRKLDVSILHYFILPKLLNIKEKIINKRNIYYYRGKSEAIKRVKSKEFKMAIFLNPTKVEEVAKIAEAGNKMPHKSTYFYPKPLTGLVIHKF